MNYKSVLRMLAVLSLISVAAAAYSGPEDGEKSFRVPQIEPVKFKSDTFNIRDFGGINDAITLNTEAFARAIQKCTSNGGGVVLVPRGTWLTGPIVMKDNVNLCVEEGALVLFSNRFDDYPLIYGYYEGTEQWRCQSPVSAVNASNIAFTGKGIFDGSGDAWRMVKKSKMTAAQWSDLIKSGGVLDKAKTTWYPSQKSLDGSLNYKPGLDKTAIEPIKDFLRPVMVSLIRCDRVLFDGPTFQNSPSWCIHPLMCQNLTVKNINVRNPWYAQNGDGIDIESCKNGIVSGCTFDVGDDAICIKSGRDEEGRKRGMPTENFIIDNCVVYHGHGGFTVGSEMSGGVRNLLVTNCTFLGTDIGLRFKSTRGRGGVVEDIFISDINMINIPTQAIDFNLFYGGTSPIPDADEVAREEVVKNAPAKPVADVTTPVFRNITMKNITCNGAEEAVRIVGLPEMGVQNITIENVNMKSQKGITLSCTENIIIRNATFETSETLPLNISASKTVKFEQTKINGKPADGNSIP